MNGFTRRTIFAKNVPKHSETQGKETIFSFFLVLIFEKEKTRQNERLRYCVQKQTERLYLFRR